MIENISAFILLLMSADPRARIVRDSDFRTEIASYIVRYSVRYDDDPFIVATWIKRESSFRVSVVSKSKHKEFGLGQFHGEAIKTCRAAGIKLGTTAGQVQCTALYIATMRKWCGGDEKRGLLAYMSGKCNGTEAAKRQYRWRMRELKRTKARMDGRQNR